MPTAGTRAAWGLAASVLKSASGLLERDACERFPASSRVRAATRTRPNGVFKRCPILGDSTDMGVRGGLSPRSWWYIPETGIHHQSKLTQSRACRAGISPARGGGSASWPRSPIL